MFYKINRRGSRIAVSFTDNDSAARIAFRRGAGTLTYCVPVNNAYEIGRAKRAVEIGLDVAIPAPVYPALVDRALYDRLVEELFDQAAIVEDAEFGTPRLDFSGVTVPAPLVRGCAYSRNAVSAPTDVGADANVYVSYTYTSGFDGNMPYTAEYAEKYHVGDAALAAIAAAAETERLARIAAMRAQERSDLARYFGVAE